MKHFERVNSPTDLKKLSILELQEYSNEARSFMIDVMSKIGGHVAANLGVVELTSAIHYVFNAPDDKIVWDVGHQVYTHKLITGRKDRFHTLRQDSGISGFTKISESEFDCFGAGHSSTAVSAGVGFAESDWQQGRDSKTVVVVGDGALTAGMAYEGMNHGGHLQRPNLIVIFNDNEMSIAENVGALAKFFNRRIHSTIYNKLRSDIKTALSTVSNREIDLVDKVKQLASSVKELFTTSHFFEALGFRYIGPVDGHDIPELVRILQDVDKIATENMKRVRETGGMETEAPILIHVRTKKGRGLKTAESRPSDFHGVTGFSKETGEPVSKPGKAPSYTSIFSQTICRLAETDKKLVGITAAMPEGTGLSKFSKMYPERFYDVGIAEQHAVTFAAAMRMNGMRPAIAIYSTFMQRAYDQVIHDAAIQGVPLALFLDRGGLVGADGPTHHGVFDMSFLRCIPGVNIMAPKDENELQHMIYTALYTDKLMSVRFPRGEGLGVALDSKFEMLEIGKAERIMPAINPTVSIWAVGVSVTTALDAARELNAQGIGTEVINARFVKPLDVEMLKESAQHAELIVTVEENAVIGGFGTAVLETLANENIQIPVVNLGIQDEFVEHGSIARQRAENHIDKAGILLEVRERMKLLNIGGGARSKSARSGSGEKTLTH